jgi:hypothetical protein
MEACVPKDQLAAQFFLGIHADDQSHIEREKCVPRRHYAAKSRSYISLREDPMEAVNRAACLFDQKCPIDKKNLLLLRIQFTHKAGFVIEGMPFELFESNNLHSGFL